MKLTVNIARVIVGLLFIFSGLVKAIDPLGLAYKMEEFFEVWKIAGHLPSLMIKLNDNALLFSIIMITLEVILGAALLLGYAKKITIWLLFLLILFFTFLTSYVLFSDKIKACGCFGDCIPLTPVQTFIKDIALLLLITLLLIRQKYIVIISTSVIRNVLMIFVLLLTIGLQWYVLNHLPLIDCLPYKIGNNILELRKIPANAIADKYEYVFIYEKNNQKKEFLVSNIPDSTWKFVDRKQKLVQKGSNNIPLINDFLLKNTAGDDSTVTILSQKEEYYLIFIKEKPKGKYDLISYIKVRAKALKNHRKIYIVTASSDVEATFRNIEDVYFCDATAIKTAARVNPTIYLMDGPIIKDKKSWKDINQLK